MARFQLDQNIDSVILLAAFLIGMQGCREAATPAQSSTATTAADGAQNSGHPGVGGVGQMVTRRLSRRG